MNFVIFLDVDWEGDGYKNRQHFLISEMAKQLEGKSKILAVERPICPWTASFRKPQIFSRWLFRRKRLRRVQPNLYIYTPFVFIHNIIAASIPFIKKLNRKLLSVLIKRMIKRVELETDCLIAWVHHPYQLEDLGLIKEKYLVYDCYDDYFSKVEGRRLADLKRREKAIIKKADLVLIASEELMKEMQNRTLRAKFVPNGADVELFNLATKTETKIPMEIDNIRRPIIGFVGKIASWLDFKLLARIVTAHPQWSFVFIGKKDDDRELIGCPGYRIFGRSSNVHLLGAKSYLSLPGFLKAFDVCIIPYLLEGQVPFSSPLKLYQYLAAGKPVVSVAISHVYSFEPLVYIGRNAEEFERHLVSALHERDNSICEQRLIVSRENSWERRADQVIKLLEGMMR